MSAATEQQPAPAAGEGEAVWPLIFDGTGLVIPEWLRADMKERHEVGVKRYGVPLRVWNGRDPVVDAYQEALDLVVYTQQARARLGGFSLTVRLSAGDIHARRVLDKAFHVSLQVALELGQLARLNVVPKHQPPGGK